jgi:hypothetical protein
MGMIAAAVIGAVGAIGGASISSKGQKDAAAKQQSATKNTLTLQKYQYDTTRADQEPWRKFGQNALANLSDPTKSFQESPDYQFRLSRGLEGVTQNKAVAGLLKSGSALKGLNDYAGASASAEYGDWYNRQMAGAGLGQTANAVNQQAGQAYANAAGQANQQNALAGMQSSYNNSQMWGQAFGQIAGIGVNYFNNRNQPTNYAHAGGGGYASSGGHSTPGL